MIFDIFRKITCFPVMRLRCRFRPLHDAYIKNGSIVENDTDVIFLCGDGHQLKAHKVIMASSSKFFAKIFEDQVCVDKLKVKAVYRNEN